MNLAPIFSTSMASKELIQNKPQETLKYIVHRRCGANEPFDKRWIGTMLWPATLKRRSWSVEKCSLKKNGTRYRCFMETNKPKLEPIQEMQQASLDSMPADDFQSMLWHTKARGIPTFCSSFWWEAKVHNKAVFQRIVIPAKAGIHASHRRRIPAFAGMTIRFDMKSMSPWIFPDENAKKRGYTSASKHPSAVYNRT